MGKALSPPVGVKGIAGGLSEADLLFFLLKSCVVDAVNAHFSLCLPCCIGLTVISPVGKYDHN